MLTPSQQLPILAAQMVAVDQGCEALRRTRRIMDRCYPNAPVGNPFVNDADRAWFMSPERGDYVLLQRRMFREVQGRLLAKIKARDAVMDGEEAVALSTVQSVVGMAHAA